MCLSSLCCNKTPSQSDSSSSSVGSVCHLPLQTELLKLYQPLNYGSAPQGTNQPDGRAESSSKHQLFRWLDTPSMTKGALSPPLLRPSDSTIAQIGCHVAAWARCCFDFGWSLASAWILYGIDIVWIHARSVSVTNRHPGDGLQHVRSIVYWVGPD